MLKNNKGITLIALVITIIVLLILAGVSIAMLTGDNGILTQATNAKNNTKAAEVADKINMALNDELANLLANNQLSGGASATATTIANANGISETEFSIVPTVANIGNSTSTEQTVLSISGTGDYDGVSGRITCTSGKYEVEKAKYPNETTSNED